MLKMKATECRVVKKAEVRHTANGKQVAEFRAVSNKRIKDKTTQEWKDGNATFFNVICWNEQQIKLAAELEVGDRFFADGEFEIREYTTKEGKKGDSKELTPDHFYRELPFVKKNTVASNQAQNFTDDNIPF